MKTYWVWVVVGGGGWVGWEWIQDSWLQHSMETTIVNFMFCALYSQGNTLRYPLNKHAVAQLVEALRYKRSRVRFPMVSLEFFFDIILPAALWPWGQLSL